MKTQVQWVDKMVMIGKSASGHKVLMDGPEALGGDNLGVRPMEMLLLGMGGCTLIDVVSTLKKMRELITNCQVEITSERGENHPKVFTKIHLHFVFDGKDLNPKKVAKAIQLSAEKYCSASIMLGKTANLTHDFSLN